MIYNFSLRYDTLGYLKIKNPENKKEGLYLEIDEKRIMDFHEGSDPSRGVYRGIKYQIYVRDRSVKTEDIPPSGIESVVSFLYETTSVWEVGYPVEQLIRKLEESKNGFINKLGELNVLVKEDVYLSISEEETPYLKHGETK